MSTSKKADSVCPEFFLYLRSTMGNLPDRLMQHPIYAEVNSIERLRLFMREHVFAVWDFMSLLKRLQRDFCGVTIPWLPPQYGDLARFVNEIVLAEETDVDGEGGYTSHFQLYLSAMKQIQADTAPIESLLAQLESGLLLSDALDSIDINPQTKEFVKFNIQLAQQGTTGQVASAFCFGREDVIPDMFSKLVETLKKQNVQSERFQYYLDRHIELDGDSHGPLARKMVGLLADSKQSEAEIAKAAKDAIQQRILLWDGILESFARSGER